MVILEPRRDVEVRASPALLPDGRQVGTVIVLNDITAANDLDRAKDELVAMVSHELRTPLASLVGFSELLLSREFSGEQRKKYLETMLKEGQRLTELINDFLDLQRMEGGFKRLALGPASLPTLITRAVAIAGENSRSPIEVELPRDLPLVVADTNAIHQVLLNLLSNARKYSPGGGLIRVEAGVVDGFVEVSVRDHGLGIPADAIPRLFKKFYRVAGVDRRGISGTGLGLAICRGIVEAHGGRIALESGGLGHGSRFYFTLQAVDRKVTAGDVLLIEDDTGFARLLEAELSLRGLSSVWAADAETADQLIGQTGARAVVLDLMLPGVSGEDFLAGLRTSHKSDVPVVVVTIKELEATESLALRSAGVVAILRKHSGAAKEAAEFVAVALESRPAGA
jgi:CheY-like chemotaxis protein